MADNRREDFALSVVAPAAAIVANAVERRFGSQRVLRGLDLEVAAGSTVALLGSNGAGKTTLLRVLAGLARPSRGSVRVLGTELPGDYRLRRRIGMVGHESYVYGDLSAVENLAYYARLYGVTDDQRALRTLAAVELDAAADRPVHTYSRGMLQRLALARAVLHEPDLLLLDEPFTGLDPDGVALLIDLLRRQRERGVTILMATHDFGLALDIADRVILLHSGRVAWQSGAALPEVAEMAKIYSRTVAGPTGRTGRRATKGRGEQ